MPTQPLPQPPRKSESRFDEWLVLLWRRVSALGEASGAQATSHTALANLNSSSYSHLTATQKDDLTDGGDSALHYHAADRDRANHTGTQTASTISDFSAAVAAAVTGGGGATATSDPLAAQIFGS